MVELVETRDPPRSPLRREQAVGDANAGVLDAQIGDDAEHGEGGGLLPAVVASGAAGAHRDGSGTDGIQTGKRLLQRGQHRLEGSGIERGVVPQHPETGAAPLRLALPHAASHALSACSRGAREDRALLEQRDRTRARDAFRLRVGGDRPVGRPEHEQACA